MKIMSKKSSDKLILNLRRILDLLQTPAVKEDVGDLCQLQVMLDLENLEAKIFVPTQTDHNTEYYNWTFIEALTELTKKHRINFQILKEDTDELCIKIFE